VATLNGDTLILSPHNPMKKFLTFLFLILALARLASAQDTLMLTGSSATSHTNYRVAQPWNNTTKTATLNVAGNSSTASSSTTSQLASLAYVSNTSGAITRGTGNFVEIGTSITAMYNGLGGTAPIGVGGWLTSGSTGRVFNQYEDYNFGYLGSTLYQWQGAGYYNTFTGGGNGQPTYGISPHQASPAVSGTPGWIRIELGANDFDQVAFNVVTWGGTLDALYSQAHNDGYHIMAVTITPRSDALSDWQEANRTAANNYILHDTVLNSGTFRDWIEDRSKFVGGQYERDTTISWDGIHPAALLAQLEATWIDHLFGGLPAPTLSEQTNSNSTQASFGAAYYASLYASQMSLTSGSNIILAPTAIANGMSLISTLYASGTWFSLMGQDFMDNNGGLGVPNQTGANANALGFGGLWQTTTPPTTPFGIAGTSETGTAGIYLSTNQTLMYTLPTPFTTGSGAVTMIDIDMVPTVPGNNSDGNISFGTVSGAGAAILALQHGDLANDGVNNQTLHGIAGTAGGSYTGIAVTGTVPLGHFEAGVVILDNVGGIYLRVKDLQGTLDVTNAATGAPQYSVYSGFPYLMVHGRGGPNEGSNFNAYYAGHILVSGSMSPAAVNSYLAWWSNRLNPAIGQWGNLGSVTLASGTGAVTSPHLYNMAGYQLVENGTNIGLRPAVSGSTVTITSPNPSDTSVATVWGAPTQ
jgi:hypothetical protein